MTNIEYTIYDACEIMIEDLALYTPFNMATEEQIITDIKDPIMDEVYIMIYTPVLQ